jgi:hypothetical protein
MASELCLLLSRGHDFCLPCPPPPCHLGPNQSLETASKLNFLGHGIAILETSRVRAFPTGQGSAFCVCLPSIQWGPHKPEALSAWREHWLEPPVKGPVTKKKKKKPLVIFSDRIPCFLSGMTLRTRFSYLHLLITGVTGLNHHTQLVC